VVDRDEALARLRAVVDARDEGDDIVIVARTDARHTHGLDEALARAKAFVEIGADVVFVEALENRDEMQRTSTEVGRPLLVNLLEGGKTPFLPFAELEAIGFKLAAYPLTLLNASIVAMQRALSELEKGRTPEGLLSFPELRRLVGFDAYDAEAARYRT
jgi:2-methylisocitrate lyase-like PEP mutase family enzyme